MVRRLGASARRAPMRARASSTSTAGRSASRSSPRKPTTCSTIPYAATPCLLLKLQRAGHGAGRAEARGRHVSTRGRAASAASATSSRSPRSARTSSPIRRARCRSSAISASAPRRRARNVIHCCADHSVYDPAEGARVVSGPAPQPLAAILLEYAAADDGLYAARHRRRRSSSTPSSTSTASSSRSSTARRRRARRSTAPASCASSRPTAARRSSAEDPRADWWRCCCRACAPAGRRSARSPLPWCSRTPACSTSMRRPPSRSTIAPYSAATGGPARSASCSSSPPAGCASRARARPPPRRLPRWCWSPSATSFAPTARASPRSRRFCSSRGRSPRGARRGAPGGAIA